MPAGSVSRHGIGSVERPWVYGTQIICADAKGRPPRGEDCEQATRPPISAPDGYLKAAKPEPRYSVAWLEPEPQARLSADLFE